MSERIVSHPSNDAYRDSWDRIFGKKPASKFTPKLNHIYVADQSTGLTLCLASEAVKHIIDGKDVLFISVELNTAAVERIIKSYMAEHVHNDDPQGQLYIRESGATVETFRELLADVTSKGKVDVVFVDYLDICTSSRIQPTDDVHMRRLILDSELHKLAVEFDTPIWTATRSERGASI